MQIYAKDSAQQNPDRPVPEPRHLLPDPRLELSPVPDEPVVNDRRDQRRPGWRDPLTFRGAVMAAVIGGLVVAGILMVAPHLWPYLLSML